MFDPNKFFNGPSWVFSQWGMFPIRRGVTIVTTLLFSLILLSVMALAPQISISNIITLSIFIILLWLFILIEFIASFAIKKYVIKENKEKKSKISSPQQSAMTPSKKIALISFAVFILFNFPSISGFIKPVVCKIPTICPKGLSSEDAKIVAILNKQSNPTLGPLASPFGFTNVKNVTGEFSIIAPNGWRVIANSPGTMILIISDNKGAASLLIIKTYPYADQLWQQSQDIFQKNKNEFSYVQNFRKTINGHNAQVEDYKINTSKPSNLTHSQLLYIDYGLFGHVFISQSWSDNFSQGKSALDAMVASFIFIK